MRLYIRDDASDAHAKARGRALPYCRAEMTVMRHPIRWRIGQTSHAARGIFRLYDQFVSVSSSPAFCHSLTAARSASARRSRSSQDRFHGGDDF